jgi:hypothetical protein
MRRDNSENGEEFGGLCLQVCRVDTILSVDRLDGNTGTASEDFIDFSVRAGGFETCLGWAGLLIIVM